MSDQILAPDDVLAGAVETARAAAVAAGGDTVGEHLGVRAEDALVVTHAFVSTLPGYQGWQWSVSLTRVPDSSEVTVDEVVQLPGDGALLAPAWVPWDQRVRPGDLSPGDLLPTTADDIRLVPGYTLSGDPAVDEVAFELGTGREQVMSRDGRLLAAERWLAGDRGPDTAMARHAPAPCGTCGFFLQLAGALSAGFGVCGNEVTDTDGQVVSVEYGCGAHSQVRAEPAAQTDAPDLVYDDGDEIEPAEPSSDTPEPSGNAVEASGSAAETSGSAVEAPGSAPEPSGSAVEPSGSAAEAAVAHDEHRADQAEQPAGETGPQPDPVAVLAEPRPEEQQDDEGHEPDGGAE